MFHCGEKVLALPISFFLFNHVEFILTERNHLTTLKIMQKIYSRGLQRELNTDPATIEKLFPMIDEHVECVSQLVQKLLERQKTTNKVNK